MQAFRFTFQLFYNKIHNHLGFLQTINDRLMYGRIFDN